MVGLRAASDYAPVRGCLLPSVLQHTLKESDLPKGRSFLRGQYELWRFSGHYLLQRRDVWQLVFVFDAADRPASGRVLHVELGRFLSEASALAARAQLVCSGGFGLWDGDAFPFADALREFDAGLDPSPCRLVPGDHVFCCRWFCGSHTLFFQHHGVFADVAVGGGSAAETAAPKPVMHFYSTGAWDSLEFIFSELSIAGLMCSDVAEFRYHSEAIFRWEAELEGAPRDPLEVSKAALRSLSPREGRPLVIYDPLRFNCEHVATWWRCGVAYCHQTNYAHSDQSFYEQRLS